MKGRERGCGKRVLSIEKLKFCSFFKRKTKNHESFSPRRFLFVSGRSRSNRMEREKRSFEKLHFFPSFFVAEI